MNRKLNNILIIILSLILISWVAYALIQTTDFDLNPNSNRQTAPPDTNQDNIKLPTATAQLSGMEHDDKTSRIHFKSNGKLFFFVFDAY